MRCVECYRKERKVWSDAKTVYHGNALCWKHFEEICVPMPKKNKK
jgi:hypothetical protein